MSTRDRFDRLRAGTLEQLAMLPRPWRRELPVDPAIELPSQAPDSGVARAAYERADELSSPALLGHCVRTWLFGELAAAVDGIDRDQELLYVACMLHDLGLTEAHTCADPRAHCFAVEGALAAEDFLSGGEWPAERTRAVTEAISLHINIRVPLERHGAEAHLLNVGAGMDVAGRGLARMPRARVDEVISRHPRGALVSELIDVMKLQVAERPAARLALMWRLGFRGYIERNPLNTGESAPPATTEVSRTS
jgi:HD domain